MRRARIVVQFVHDMKCGLQAVAAICHAGWMLVSAKVCAGEQATSFYRSARRLAAGAKWSDERLSGCKP